MTTTDNKEKIKIFLQESQHVQDMISSAINQSYTVFGVVVPSIFAITLFLAEKNMKYLPIEYLSLILVSLLSISILFCASLWMEVFQYLRYKYLVLVPRMYQIVGQENEENFFQYGSRIRKLESFIPTALFQLLIILFTGTFSVYGIIEGTTANDSKRFYLLIIAFVLLLITAIGVAVTWRAGVHIVDQTHFHGNDNNLG